jgi:hypothetical protein
VSYRRRGKSFDGFGGAARQFAFVVGRSCRWKVRHETLESASISANKQKQKHGRSLVPYECRFCGGYHLATKRV